MPGDSELIRELMELSDRTKAIGHALARSNDSAIIAPPISPTYGSYARSIVRSRDRLRRKLPTYLVCDPAFDILLELFAAYELRESLCVSSICLAAGCPPTTGLRWVKVLEREGLIERHADPDDRRRIFLQLTDGAYQLVRDWISQISKSTDTTGLA